jgi:hypothetical protein
MIITFIVISSLLFITGIFGIFGACFGNTCCLGFFTVLIVFWLLVSISLGIISFVFPKVILDQGCDTSRMNIQQLKDRMTSAERILCKKDCQCYYQNPQ